MHTPHGPLSILRWPPKYASHTTLSMAVEQVRRAQGLVERATQLGLHAVLAKATETWGENALIAASALVLEKIISFYTDLNDVMAVLNDRDSDWCPTRGPCPGQLVWHVPGPAGGCKRLTAHYHLGRTLAQRSPP